MHRLLQFTRDLFEGTPFASPPAAAKPPAAPRRGAAPPVVAGALPPAVTGDSPSAPHPGASASSVGTETPQPLGSLLQPTAFRHPRANRESRLGDALVAYEFRRGKRKTIGFMVDSDGLVVSAPRWVPLYEVEAALQEKGRWVVNKLAEARERHQRLQASRIDWRDGASFPFLGEPVTVVLDPRHGFSEAGAVLHTDASAANLTLAGVSRLTLHVGLAHNATPEQVRDAVQAWLMRQAKRIFAERLDHFAPRLGVQWRKLSLSSAGTRWGSARSDGAIRLNWRLIHFNQAAIDYVVAHELSHLRVMDHSPRFWDTVRSVMPDYEQVRGQLKDDAIPRWG